MRMRAPPLPQRRTLCPTPSEQRHVPNRCSCKLTASHAEPSRRPRPRCTVVQVHSIEKNAACKDWNKKASPDTHSHITGANADLERARHCPYTQPFAQQRTSCSLPAGVTPSEQRHVPNRRGCEPSARHAEPSCRPHPRCTVVQVHSIQTGACRRTYDKTSGRTDNKAPTLLHAQTPETYAIINTSHLDFASSPQRTSPCSQPL